MSTDLIPPVDPALRDMPPAQAQSPFNRMPSLHGAGINGGAVAIEQERAIAEVQGQIVVAQKFRRSMAAVRADFLDACKDPAFAKAAFYTVPNRGTGPSIRFAEEVARCYGNFQYGHRELSRTETSKDAIGKSEVEVFAWDVEKNNRSIRQITVLHVRDKQGGATKLTDQTDIDNRVANVASKQMRGRILALMPKHIVQAGIDACKLTLAGGNDKPISERINGMVEAFKKYGVSVEHLESYLTHKVDATTVDELADLIGIFNAVKEGAKPSEYFKIAAGESAGGQAVAGALTNAAKKGTDTPAAKPAAAPGPEASAPAAAPAPTPAPTAAPAPAATPAPAPARAQRREPPPPPPPAPAPVAKAQASDDQFGGPPPDTDDDVF